MDFIEDDDRDKKPDDVKILIRTRLTKKMMMMTMKKIDKNKREN